MNNNSLPVLLLVKSIIDEEIISCITIKIQFFLKVLSTANTFGVFKKMVNSAKTPINTIGNK